MEKYGAWGEKNLYGKKVTGALRSTFVIDEQGHIAHVFRKVDTGRHSRDVIAALDEMQ
jgi:peroxiredoxin Q/BCP